MVVGTGRPQRGWGGRPRLGAVKGRPVVAVCWGWVLSGRESPEQSVLRGAVCDCLRAVQVGRQLLGDATTRTVLEGPASPEGWP